MTRTNETPLRILFTDLNRFGPAPTPGREVAALAVNAVTVAVLAVVLLDGGPVGLGFAAVCAVYLLTRLTVGVRRWRSHAADGGAR